MIHQGEMLNYFVDTLNQSWHQRVVLGLNQLMGSLWTQKRITSWSKHVSAHFLTLTFTHIFRPMALLIWSSLVIKSNIFSTRVFRLPVIKGKKERTEALCTKLLLCMGFGKGPDHKVYYTQFYFAFHVTYYNMLKHYQGEGGFAQPENYIVHIRQKLIFTAIYYILDPFNIAQWSRGLKSLLGYWFNSH